MNNIANRALDELFHHTYETTEDHDSNICHICDLYHAHEDLGLNWRDQDGNPPPPYDQLCHRCLNNLGYTYHPKKTI